MALNCAVAPGSVLCRLRQQQSDDFSICARGQLVRRGASGVTVQNREPAAGRLTQSGAQHRTAGRRVRGAGERPVPTRSVNRHEGGYGTERCLVRLPAQQAARDLVLRVDIQCALQTVAAFVGALHTRRQPEPVAL